MIGHFDLGFQQSRAVMKEPDVPEMISELIGKTILVVDDEENDIVLLQRLFKMARLANPIIVLRNGEEAIAYLKGDGQFADREKYPIPNILMLDLKMPRTDGFEVLQWIKEQPHLKGMLVIVLSQLTDIKDVSRAYDLGAKTFLTKPCTEAELGNLMNTYRGYWSLTDSNDAATRTE